MAEQPDPFRRRLDAAAGLTVDIGHMKNISGYLDTLAAAVRGEVTEVARRADEVLRVGRYQQSAFGGDRMIPEVPSLAQRTRGVYDNVESNLTDIAKALADTARAIERIADRYARVEELNRLSAVEVSRLLPPSRTPPHG